MNIVFLHTMNSTEMGDKWPCESDAWAGVSRAKTVNYQGFS